MQCNFELMQNNIQWVALVSNSDLETYLLARQAPPVSALFGEHGSEATHFPHFNSQNE